VVKVPSKPVTRSAAKRMPSMHTSQAPDEAPEAFTETDLPDYKDSLSLIIELQEQLKKAHFVIAQLQHESREMKKKALEQAFKKDILVEGEILLPLTPIGSKEKGKGKEVELNPEVEEICMPRLSFTRSSVRKLHTQEGTPSKDQSTTKEKK